jgi:hypothetical protein
MSMMTLHILYVGRLLGLLLKYCLEEIDINPILLLEAMTYFDPHCSANSQERKFASHSGKYGFY